jgi:hypothetical protein
MIAIARHTVEESKIILARPDDDAQVAQVTVTAEDLDNAVSKTAFSWNDCCWLEVTDVGTGEISAYDTISGAWLKKL